MLVGVIIEVINYAYRGEKAMLVGVIAEVNVESEWSNPNPRPK